MALFNKKGGGGPAPDGEVQQPPAVQQPARRVYCKVCEKDTTFSKCWKRLLPLKACSVCKAPFRVPKQIYDMQVPHCPKCGEYVEHPGFDYGVCDECNSRFELVEGCVPGLLPNRKQRAEMEQYGKIRYLK